jgi:hypothetical protein
MFGLDFETSNERGKEVAAKALAELGGHPGVINSFPVDRGEANRTMMMLYLRLGQDADASGDSALGERLRAAAVRLGSNIATAGSRAHVGIPDDELELVRKALDARSAHGAKAEGFVGAVERLLAKVKILFVSANTPDSDRIDVADEERAIREAIARSRHRDSIELVSIQAATIDDLRRALLDSDYTVIHFAGHADELGLFFADPLETSIHATMPKLADLLSGHPSVKCVVLSGCAALAEPFELAEDTIGMTEEVANGASVEFARGFYDAVGAGKGHDDALREGKVNAELKGFGCPVRLVTRRRP